MLWLNIDQGDGGALGFVIALILLSIWKSESLPSSSPTTHIVSFVNQQKTKEKTQNEFPDFDFEDIQGDDSLTKNIHPHRSSPIREVLENIVENLRTRFENTINMGNESTHLNSDGVGTDEKNKHDIRSSSLQKTLPASLDFTLGFQESGEIFKNVNLEDQDSPARSTSFANGIWNRAKQRLIVLKPVRNLLTTVQNRIHGNVPAATQHSKSRPTTHLLRNDNFSGDGIDEDQHTVTPISGVTHESPIETSNERVMISESAGFHVLELFGTIIGLAWGFLSNLQAIFAASSGGGSSVVGAGSGSGGPANT